MALMAIMGLGLLCGLYGYFGFTAIVFTCFWGFRIVDSNMLGLISFTRPSSTSPFEPCDQGSWGQQIGSLGL